MYKPLPTRMKQLSSYISLQLVLPTLKLERHMGESNHLIFQFFSWTFSWTIKLGEKVYIFFLFLAFFSNQTKCDMTKMYEHNKIGPFLDSIFSSNPQKSVLPVKGNWVA